MPDSHPTTAEDQARVDTCGWSGTLGHELDAAKDAVAHEKADVETERMQGVDCWRCEDGIPHFHKAALAKAVAHE